MSSGGLSVSLTGADEHPLLTSFEDANLQERLLRSIYSYGLEKPSVIQQRVLRPILDGRDLICQAASGTSRTETYVIGSLQRINVSRRKCQALMLAPNRELAYSIYKMVLALGAPLSIECQVCVSPSLDIESFRGGQQVVVGTPGPVLDAIVKRHLNIDDLLMLVMDEAAEMLSPGIQSQISNTLRRLPRNVQTCVFSATVPPEIFDLGIKFMGDAVRVLVKKDESTMGGIRQFYVAFDKEEAKMDTLCDLYNIIQSTCKPISLLWRDGLVLGTSLSGQGVLTIQGLYSDSTCLILRQKVAEAWRKSVNDVTLYKTGEIMAEAEPIGDLDQVVVAMSKKVIVYCNTRRKVSIITEEIEKRHLAVCSMHGNIDQQERELVMQEFQSGTAAQVLITTDLLARGIDMQQISLVINFDLPSNAEEYTMRIGRSICLGRKGTVISFVTGNDTRTVKFIQECYRQPMEEMPMDITDLI